MNDGEVDGDFENLASTAREVQEEWCNIVRSDGWWAVKMDKGRQTWTPLTRVVHRRTVCIRWHTQWRWVLCMTGKAWLA